MVQEIITYLIVLWAFYQAGKALWKNISALKNDTYVCSSTGCAGCSAKRSLLKDIEKINIPTQPPTPDK